MKKILSFTAVAVLVASLSICFAAGTTTVGKPQPLIINQSDYCRNCQDNIKKSVRITMTADSAGSSTLGAFTAATIPQAGILGWLPYTIKVIPGTPAPTANWALTLKDSDGVSFDGGGLVNLGASTKTIYNLGSVSGKGYMIVPGDLTLTVTSNSVAGANIVIEIMFYPE